MRSAKPAPPPAEGGSRYRDGVRAAAPLVIAVAAFGVSFGVLARSTGMGRLAPIVMSLTTFAGSAQFAATSILGAGGGVAAAIAAAVLLNLRYGPMGLSAAQALDGPWWRRLLTAQLVVDESWALAQREDGRIDRRLLIGAGLALGAGWICGTTVGVLAGDLVADPSSLGLDAAFPALFLALLVGQLARRETQTTAGEGRSERPVTVSRRASWLRDRTRVLAAVVGGAIALALLPVAGPGVPIVAASLACLVGARRS
ncbi:MAG TPA: AzlC family ABC transporter permease [Actinomycetota bacterium]|nr:AzlC family ABC transporter permease [Actinomycetota bacterium]